MLAEVIHTISVWDGIENNCGVRDEKYDQICTSTEVHKNNHQLIVRRILCARNPEPFIHCAISSKHFANSNKISVNFSGCES